MLTDERIGVIMEAGQENVLLTRFPVRSNPYFSLMACRLKSHCFHSPALTLRPVFIERRVSKMFINPKSRHSLFLGLCAAALTTAAMPAASADQFKLVYTGAFDSRDALNLAGAATTNFTGSVHGDGPLRHGKPEYCGCSRNSRICRVFALCGDPDSRRRYLQYSNLRPKCENRRDRRHFR